MLPWRKGTNDFLVFTRIAGYNYKFDWFVAISNLPIRIILFGGRYFRRQNYQFGGRERKPFLKVNYITSFLISFSDDKILLVILLRDDRTAYKFLLRSKIFHLLSVKSNNNAVNNFYFHQQIILQEVKTRK